MARETAWGAADLAISKRLCNTYAHAWRELQPASRQDRLAIKSNYLRFAIASVIGLALAWPVPMTALAPVEIVANGATIVASPIDGVVESIEVDPNSPVKAGDVLVRFTDTQLRNRREIAVREVAVAQARVRQANLLAFSDPKGRHELAIAESELELKRAELDYAADMLEKSVIRAPRDGIAVYADRKSLVGKPVVTGERLIEVADPQNVEGRVDVAVDDVIALKQDGGATLFLDVDPLRPISGRILRADHKARMSDGDLLSFRAYVQLELDGKVPPRMGLRGTAQIRGDKAPAGLVLFRRPISAARQWLGL
jgi:multidrug efflux pump subunit AcrA (membrane-fusion protein)